MRHPILFLISCLALFCALSAVLYQAVPVHPRAHCDIDSSAYLEKATMLQTTGSMLKPGEPIPYYALGYAALLGSLFKACGNPCIPTVIFIQIICSCLIILLAYALGTLVAGRCTGTLAAALASVNVGLLTFAQFVLTETTLTLMLALFVYALAYGIITKNTLSYGLAGAALGCSVLIKPAALYYPLLLIPLLLAGWVARQQPCAKTIVFFCACYALPIGLYAGTWRMQQGTWYLSSLSTMNMTVWFYPYVRAHLEHSDVATQRTLIMRIYEQPGGPEMLSSQVQTAWHTYPFLCTKLWLYNVAKTWFGLFASNLKLLLDPGLRGGFGISFSTTQGPWWQRACTYVQRGCNNPSALALAWYETIWSCVRLPLFILGLYALYVGHGLWALALMLSYFTYFSLITGHDGCSRFRMMFEMPLTVVVACGMCWLLYNRKVRQ